jgi:hypothetical protein
MRLLLGVFLLSCAAASADTIDGITYNWNYQDGSITRNWLFS